jgi:hypothetical protein
VVPLIGDRKRSVERLFEAAGKSWHQAFQFICIGRSRLTSFPSRTAKDADVCAQSP